VAASAVDDSGCDDGGGRVSYILHGGNYNEMPMGDYMEEKTVVGMKMKIGGAPRQDGITFGRVKGDDPSGVIMFPYDAWDCNIK